jgi:hypothetical protein
MIEKFEFEDKTTVRSIWANAQKFIVGHHSGLLEVCEWNSKSTQFEFSLNIEYEYPLKAVQVSNDGKYMVAYCENREKKQDTEYLEYVVIHNLQTNKEINKVTLDLDDDTESRERAQDLFIIAQDSQTLIMRSDNR